MHPERTLRQYDKALRLRASQEGPEILLERKTFRGRIGALGPAGTAWRPDTGRRREEGHVLVLSIHPSEFHVQRLQDALRASDTWRHTVPLWKRADEADNVAKQRLRRARSDGLRYKASELFDRYVWRYKQRVSVPAQIA